MTTKTNSSDLVQTKEGDFELNAFAIYLQNIANIECHLTPRQNLICELICCGLKVPEIAKKLCKSTYTIEMHIRHIKNKTQIHSITALACWYGSKQYQKITESSYIQTEKFDL